MMKSSRFEKDKKIKDHINKDVKNLSRLQGQIGEAKERNR